MSLPSAVVLMGVCGSGKTTVGLALAERCGGMFYDADDFHPQSNIAKMKRGEPLDDADRAPWLDELALRLAAASVERRQWFSHAPRSSSNIEISFGRVVLICNSSIFLVLPR